MHISILDGRKLISGDAKPTWDATSRIVLVGGCFDILHYGHFTFLQSAKTRGDILVVALENDEFIQKRKKRAPFHTQQQRAEMLAQLRAVDIVVNLPTLTSTEAYIQLVKSIKPSVIAVTRGDAHLAQKKLCAEAVGAEIHEVCDPIPRLSSSTLLNYAHLLHD